MVLSEQVLFSVPIYRETETAFYDYLKAQHEKSNRGGLEEIGSSQIDADAEFIRKTFHYNRERKCWRYNRIIGWIDFYADGETLKAELYLARGTIRRNYKNIIMDCRSKIADVLHAGGKGNEEIWREIHLFMERLGKGEYRKLPNGSFVDSNFIRFLEYTDIKALMRSKSNQEEEPTL